MAQGLEVIVLDDDADVSHVLVRMVESFYTTGPVYGFTDFVEARTHCFDSGSTLAIFLLDVYMGEKTAFDFIDAVKVHFPMAAEDSIIITGFADDKVVDRCLESGVNYLLEKPVKPYALQLAVRAIASKYTSFAQKLMKDSEFAQNVVRLDNFIND